MQTTFDRARRAVCASAQLMVPAYVSQHEADDFVAAVHDMSAAEVMAELGHVRDSAAVDPAYATLLRQHGF